MRRQRSGLAWLRPALFIGPGGVSRSYLPRSAEMEGRDREGPYQGGVTRKTLKANARQASQCDPAGPISYSGAGAMAATSRLGPVLGAGLAQRISPRRLAAAVAALDRVTVI